MTSCKSHTNTVFVILFLTLMAAGVITWELAALPYSDDWFYMHTYSNKPGAGFLCPGDELITTPAQAADSFMRHYVDFGSRLTHLFVYFSYLLPSWLTDIIDGIAITVMLMLIVTTACGKNGLKSPLAVTVTATLMWIVLPWDDNMVSHDYQINYVWSTLPTLWFLYIYLYRSSSASQASMRWAAVAAFVAGAMHEGLSLPAAGAALIVWISQPKLRRARRPMLICLIIGVAFCIGPGTLNRLFYGKEATFRLDAYQWFASRAILALMPWAFLAGALALASVKKGILSAWRLLKPEWPWLLMAIASYTIGLFMTRMGRTLWMMDLCIIIVTVRILAQCTPSSFKLKTALAAVLATLNIAFIVELYHWQRIASTDQQYSIDLIKSAHNREIYTRLPLQQNAPWWTLGIPRRYDGLDGLAQFTLSAAMDSTRKAFYPILPVSCKGKRFEDWPKIAGDNPFRGEFPNLYGRDSVDMMLTITVGQPLPDMSPINRLLAFASGSDQVRHLTVTPQILWDGDSGKIYKYSLAALPRTIKSRRFIQLNVEK